MGLSKTQDTTHKLPTKMGRRCRGVDARGPGTCRVRVVLPPFRKRPLSVGPGAPLPPHAPLPPAPSPPSSVGSSCEGAQGSLWRSHGASWLQTVVHAEIPRFGNEQQAVPCHQAPLIRKCGRGLDMAGTGRGLGALRPPARRCPATSSLCLGRLPSLPCPTLLASPPSTPASAARPLGNAAQTAGAAETGLRGWQSHAPAQPSGLW